MSHSRTIGLTGGIASGKTTVANLFIGLGVPLLEADEVAREVVAPPSPVLTAIARQFGQEFIQPDGSLDRRRMREHVFGNPEALRALEAITHPAIRARIRAWRDAQTRPYCILSAAILVESRMDSLVDRVLVVDVSPERQLERLLARDGIDEALAHKMIATQASPEARRARADDIIDNGRDVAGLAAHVRRLHSLYSRLDAPRPTG
jgi:dephospho-CoA kinase